MLVIFDLDGTLADCEHRRHFVAGSRKNWPAFFGACINDELIGHTFSVFAAMVRAGHDVEIWSGRSDEVRRHTELWLRDKGIKPSHLTRMRREGDFTPDT